LSAFLRNVGADRFHLVPCDLQSSSAIAPHLPGEFSSELPTVVVADDVFQFLNADAVDSILRWTAALPCVALVLSTPTMPLVDDVFAAALTNVMRLRHIDLFLQHWDSAHALQTALRHFETVATSTLLDVWQCVADDERLRIAALEPFDEFEDLAAHASRHSVALACRGLGVACDDLLPAPQRAPVAAAGPLRANSVVYPSTSNTRKQIERWGASLCVVGRTAVVFGGFGGGGGAHARLSSISVASYSPTRECWTWQPLSTAGVAPSARMHHAATTLALHDGTPVAVLLGGRANAPAALADVFVLRVDAARWLNVELSGQVQARFRHTLTRVADASAVAIGGRCGERVLGLVFVDVLTLARGIDDTAVAVQIEAKATHGDAPRARFAHASAFLPHLNAIAVLGGLDACERCVSCNELHLLDLASWTWRTVELGGAAAPVALFSHSMHAVGTRLWVLGGGADSVRCIDSATMQWLPERYSVHANNFVLWQHSSALIDDRELLVIGGGFACGRHEHFNSYARVLLDSSASFAVSDDNVTPAVPLSSTPAATNVVRACVQSIDVIHDVSTSQFESIVARKMPAIFRGCDFGRARELWTPTHMKANGGSVDVSVHACNSPFLDFQSRNYSFRSMTFGALIDSVYGGGAPDEYLYLRSVGANPRKDVADVWSQWPMLCNDGQLRVPETMAPLVSPHLFSSVFRVSSANVWVFTHYDVCDNILIGVRGRKRVVLFAPRDVDRLYVDGSTSRIVDIDSAAQSTQFPRFRKAYERRYEAVLEEGDILYIPALWFHTTFTIGAPAIGVNMFWRDPALPREFLSTRDLYGNVDPTPAAQLLRELAIEDHGTAKPPSLNALLRALEQLPAHYRDFYGRKFVDAIQHRLSLE
jgi:tRNA wybutosine-synthesizing protein 5